MEETVRSDFMIFVKPFCFCRLNKTFRFFHRFTQTEVECRFDVVAVKDFYQFTVFDHSVIIAECHRFQFAAGVGEFLVDSFAAWGPGVNRAAGEEL